MNNEKRNLVILGSAATIATFTLFALCINESLCDHTKEICITTRICGINHQINKIEEQGYEIDESTNDEQIVFRDKGKIYFLKR